MSVVQYIGTTMPALLAAIVMSSLVPITAPAQTMASILHEWDSIANHAPLTSQDATHSQEGLRGMIGFELQVMARDRRNRVLNKAVQKRLDGASLVIRVSERFETHELVIKRLPNGNRVIDRAPTRSGTVVWIVGSGDRLVLLYLDRKHRVKTIDLPWHPLAAQLRDERASLKNSYFGHPWPLETLISIWSPDVKTHIQTELLRPYGQSNYQGQPIAESLRTIAILLGQQLLHHQC